jgi:hypothetical protein
MSKTEELRQITSLFKPPCLLPARRRTLWSFPSMVKPALVAKKFGKGDLLLGLSPILHRPWYYLVWVDAQWMSIDSDEIMHDHVDEICDAIAEEFGSRDPDEDGGYYRWPEDDTGDGVCWWKADIDDVLTPRARKKFDLKAERTAK